MNETERKWLAEAERVHAGVWKSRKNRRRRKPGIMEAMTLAEQKRERAAATRARRKAEREDVLRPPDPLERSLER